MHREPEIGLDLPRTQERVLDELVGLPLEIGTGTRTTSVTAVLRGGRRTETDPSTVLLRADMDALPVVEQTGPTSPPVERGHARLRTRPAHRALVGAARLLVAHRDRLAGDVVLMFQPGEEGWHGAKIMLDEGVLDASGRRPDAAYGLHVMSGGKPRGRFAAKPGPMLAASDELVVTVRGAGGHGSPPHRAADPIAAAARDGHRRCRRWSPAPSTCSIRSSITVANMRAGTRHNIIPDEAHFEATVRCYSSESFDRVPDAIRRVLEGVASAHRVHVEHACDPEFPMTVNDENETAFAAGVVSDLMGEDRYETVRHPMSGSEDFSYVLGEIPGAFVSLGACVPGMDPSEAPTNHSPRAQFDDAVLGDAAAIYAGLAARRLDDAATNLTVVAGRSSPMNATTRTDTAAGPRTPGRWEQARAIVGVGTGNGVEYFDWTVYAVFAAFFAPQFFHTGNPISDLLATFGVFAVGFAARPFGGLLFGRIADRHGRKLSMTLAVGLASLGSLAIGVSPTYGTIGIAAAGILVLARLAQGVAHGGELPSAQTYIIEYAPTERRGKWSSLIYVSNTGGVVVGTCWPPCSPRHSATPR